MKNSISQNHLSINNIIFLRESWEEYLYFQENDKKNLKRINLLIKDIIRNPYDIGIGKTEVLHANFSGYYSRRINKEHRLVYKITGESIIIVKCKSHYLN